MLSMLRELIEMDVPDVDADGREKQYFDAGHAKEEATKFISRARDVLNLNKKEGGNEEVAKLAHQFAKDYYQSICDEINTMKYNGGEKTGVADFGPEGEPYK